MPAIARLDRELGGRGLQVIGVSVDAAGSSADIDRFTQEHEIGFPIVLDPAQHVARAFRTIGVPETFLVDRGGLIARRWIGAFHPLDPDVRASIERVLAN